MKNSTVNSILVCLLMISSVPFALLIAFGYIRIGGDNTMKACFRFLDDIFGE